MTASEEDTDEELWTPFLALRREDRRAARIREHVQEDVKRGRAHPPRRAAALSRDEIVRAAIRIADAEGADAVSMRRIARELNAGTMSLYWHIASKEELLGRMIDTVLGGRHAPEPSGDWQADLRTMAGNVRVALHQHRWMMDFMGGRPRVGPRSLRNIERALASLGALSLHEGTAMTIVMTVLTYVQGAVLREIQEMNGERYMQEYLADVPPQQQQAAVRDFAERLRASGRYPHMAAMIAEGVDPDAPETRDDRFSFGLDCLLEGIAAAIRR